MKKRCGNCTHFILDYDHDTIGVCNAPAPMVADDISYRETLINSKAKECETYIPVNRKKNK